MLTQSIKKQFTIKRFNELKFTLNPTLNLNLNFILKCLSIVLSTPIFISAFSSTTLAAGVLSVGQCDDIRTAYFFEESMNQEPDRLKIFENVGTPSESIRLYERRIDDRPLSDQLIFVQDNAVSAVVTAVTLFVPMKMFLFRAAAEAGEGALTSFMRFIYTKETKNRSSLYLMHTEPPQPWKMKNAFDLVGRGIYETEGVGSAAITSLTELEKAGIERLASYGINKNNIRAYVLGVRNTGVILASGSSLYALKLAFPLVAGSSNICDIVKNPERYAFR